MEERKGRPLRRTAAPLRVQYIHLMRMPLPFTPLYPKPDGVKIRLDGGLR